ncbi:MAG: type II toxin-antitoxin system RelE/ParE family toxin [Candidatus Sungbacteria bacterium]|nr:type II toxin-antitoxin system RelE/ParE family toxin [bacterium]MDZ4285510.1 type II toxin-antitoxin system RelE/ParE family toxin [Candidatus Sungbacteria bacterium]
MKDRFVVHVPHTVQKAIRNVSLPWRNRIIAAIDALERDPFYGEKMMGRLAGKYKIRVWPYRIIYAIDKKKKIVVLLEVGHRGGISYK